MRIQAALLARYAETDPDSGLLNLMGGGLDVFGLNELPARFPVAFAIILRFPEAEAGEPVELQLVVRGPNLETVGEPTSFEITPGLGEYHAPGWEGTFTVAGAVRLVIESAGVHSISIQNCWGRGGRHTVPSHPRRWIGAPQARYARREGHRRQSHQPVNARSRGVRRASYAAWPMSLPSAYLITTKNVEALIAAVQSAKAPSKFTQRFLEGLDFKSTNDRLYINVFKALGLLTEDGTPTNRYYEFMDQRQSSRVLAEAIEEAYADLFQIRRDAQNMSRAELKGKIKTLTQGQYSDNVVDKMAQTFLALAAVADFDSVPPQDENGDQGPAHEPVPEVRVQGVAGWLIRTRVGSRRGRVAGGLALRTVWCRS